MKSNDLNTNLSYNTRRAREVPSRFSPANTEQEFTRDIDYLYTKFTPLRKSVARKLASSVPSYVDQEDLVSYINEQFVKLVREYDPTSGVDFPGYISKMLMTRAKYLFVRPVNRKQEQEAQTSDEEILSQIDKEDADEIITNSLSDIIAHVETKVHLTEQDKEVIAMLSEMTPKAIIRELKKQDVEDPENYVEELKYTLQQALTDYYN